VLTLNKKVLRFFIVFSIALAIAVATLSYFLYNTTVELEKANQKLTELSFDEEGATRKLTGDEDNYIGIVTVSVDKWIYSTNPDITYQETPSGNLLNTIYAELAENKIVFASEGDKAKLKYNAVSQCNGHTFYQIIVDGNTYYITTA
jgi:hypothetical protein